MFIAAGEACNAEQVFRALNDSVVSVACSTVAVVCRWSAVGGDAWWSSLSFAGGSSAVLVSSSGRRLISSFLKSGESM